MARMPKMMVDIGVRTVPPIPEVEKVLRGLYIANGYTPPQAVKAAKLGSRLLGLSKDPLHEITKAEHYNQGRFEVIEVTDDWELDHYRATIVTYVARCAFKGSLLKDLRKAKYYLDRLITLTEENRGPLAIADFNETRQRSSLLDRQRTANSG